MGRNNHTVMKPRNRLWVPAVLAAILCGCAEAPRPVEKAKAPAKPPEPVTGRWAFHQMYSAARAWAPDIQGLRLRSLHLEGVPYQAGKAAAWEATFVSPSLGRARTYTYSVIEAPGNLHEGVFAGLEETYSGPRGGAEPYPIAAVKTDSNEVYETALKKGADYAKKHPDMRVNFILERTRRFPNPAWRVLWGDSVATSNFSILVDASTGEYLQTLR